MNELPRQKLCEIITQYGQDIYKNPQRFEGLLRDFCGQYCKEIAVLVGALKDGVPDRLMASKNSVPHVILLAQLGKRLQDNLGLAEETAIWAVESWALALGVISVVSPSKPQKGSSYSQKESHQIQQYSNIQPVWKFVFLYIITFGIYQIPWGHKHWKFIKQREGLKINAWLRSWFLPFTLFWLAKRIFALAEEKEYPEKPSPAAITSLFWFFVVLGKLPGGIGLIALLSFFPLLTVLKAANFYWEKEQPNLPLRKSWTGGEIAWTVFGVIFWLLALIGLFTPSEG